MTTSFRPPATEQPDDTWAVGAERLANADLARPPGHAVADHAVGADCERQHPERREDEGRAGWGNRISASWLSIVFVSRTRRSESSSRPEASRASAVGSASMDILATTVSDGMNRYDY